MSEPLLTAREVARRYRVSARTVYRLCQLGDLPFTRVGRGRQIRIERRDAERYLAQRRRRG